jgi:sulfate adenylyltransferase subunit 1
MSALATKVETVDLLRFITAGNVDDGKSTLIGRLLFDSKSLFDDQINSIRAHGTGEINFANLTDGLRAEREQGITIDVAHRYFSTPKRNFILADSPGHVQYTKNMITAASNTSLTVIVVDATRGITEQTLRHSYISCLLGIRHLVVCVNKMDLVDYSEAVYHDIQKRFYEFAESIKFSTIKFIPISALHGDNLARPSEQIHWYSGPTLLRYLEEIKVDDEQPNSAARFTVQWVIKPGSSGSSSSSNSAGYKNGIGRGYAGQIQSGRFSVGDDVVILPSGQKSRIKQISTFDGLLEVATSRLSVTIVLEDELDIARGDVLAHHNVIPEFNGANSRNTAPTVGHDISATVCWMDDQPLKPGRTYIIKQSSRKTRAKVSSLNGKIDIDTLTRSTDAIAQLEQNEIGFVSFTSANPLVYDKYENNRLTGSFIVVDELTNRTAGAGLITA